MKRLDAHPYKIISLQWSSYLRADLAIACLSTPHSPKTKSDVLYDSLNRLFMSHRYLRGEKLDE